MMQVPLHFRNTINTTSNKLMNFFNQCQQAEVAQQSDYTTEKERIIALLFIHLKNNTTSSPGFLGQRFNNLQPAAFDVIDSIWEHFFQIWSTAAGYDEICEWF